MELFADFTQPNSYGVEPRSRAKVRYTKLNHHDNKDDLEEAEGGLACVELQEGSMDDSDGYQSAGSTTSTRIKSYTVEEAVEAIGFGWFQVRLFFLCGLFTAADALEMMLLAVLSPVLRCEWQLTHFHVALITTVVFIGMCIMAPVWGVIGDRYGRQVTLYMVTLWIGYFGFLTTFSPSFVWLLILRGLVGSGLAGSPQGFALMTEYLPSKSRAKMLLLGNIAWASGTLFEITMASFVIPSLGWRWLLVFSAAPSFIIVILLKWLPESARYLVAAGNKEEAMKILQKAAKINNKSLPEGRLIASVATRRGDFRNLFSPEYRRTTLQVWFMWFVSAFSYYGMVLASAEILQLHNERSGETDTCMCNQLKSDDYVAIIISTLGEFINLPINMSLIDRIGRRYTGAVNCACCAIFFILLQIHMPQQLLTAIMFMVRGFSQGMFSFAYIYTGEVYPTSIRTLGIGSASAWARVGAMITPFVAQVLLDKSVQAAVWVYGAFGISAAVCAALLPIETKGRDLPQSVS